MFIYPVDGTSNVLYVNLRDATGEGKTGLVFNTASLKAYYTRPKGSATAITLVTQTVTGAWTSGGFVEVDPTNAKGLYRIDIPDAAFVSGASYFVLSIGGASGMVFAHVLVFLDALPDVVTGSAVTDAGNSSIQFKSDRTEATDNVFKDGWILWRTGALANQIKKVSTYTGSTKIFVMTAAFTGTPANGDKFIWINR